MAESGIYFRGANIIIYIYIKPKLLKLPQFSTLAHLKKKKKKPKKKTFLNLKKKKNARDFLKPKLIYTLRLLLFASSVLSASLNSQTPQAPASHSFSGWKFLILRLYHQTRFSPQTLPISFLFCSIILAVKYDLGFRFWFFASFVWNYGF